MASARTAGLRSSSLWAVLGAALSPGAGAQDPLRYYLAVVATQPVNEEGPDDDDDQCAQQQAERREKNASARDHQSLSRMIPSMSIVLPSNENVSTFALRSVLPFPFVARSVNVVPSQSHVPLMRTAFARGMS